MPDLQITGIQWRGGHVHIQARYVGPVACPDCGGARLRSEGWCPSRVRHEDLGLRHSVLELSVPKSQCLDCGRYFRQPPPGIRPRQRASGAFKECIFRQHLDGINRSRLGRHEAIGAATVERYFR